MIFENFEIALVLLEQKFSKMHSGSLSQIALPNMWLLVLIAQAIQHKLPPTE